MSDDVVDSFRKEVDRKFTDFEKNMLLEINSEKEKIQASKENFEDLVRMAKWIGAISSILLAVLTFIVGKNMSDIQLTAKSAAQNAFQDVIREKTKEGERLNELIKTAKISSEELLKIEDSLKGYKDLVGVVKSGSDFDPLVGYYSIDREIDEREEKTKAFLRGDDVKISETTRDTAFRQKCAVIFEKLLREVQSDFKKNITRVDPNTLYNAAANASKIDMDFVALDLMEIAASLDKKSSADIGARLIRQKITMSKISPQVALKELKEIISKSKGSNIHLVASESYNIGNLLMAQKEVAAIIDESTPKELKNISYVRLKIASLLMSGSSKDDWDTAKLNICAGLRAMREEPKSVGWYKHSKNEIKRILLEDPSFLDKASMKCSGDNIGATIKE